MQTPAVPSPDELSPDLAVHAAGELASSLPPGEVVGSDTGVALNPSPLVDAALTIDDVDNSWLEAPPACPEDRVEMLYKCISYISLHLCIVDNSHLYRSS